MPMKRFKAFKIVSILAVALSIGVGASTLAAQENRRPRMRCEENFVKMDTDKDGKISLAEFSAVDHPRGDAKALFKEKDADKDGFLTKAELCATGAGRGRGRGGY
jgi:hypothetical protein